MSTISWLGGSITADIEISTLSTTRASRVVQHDVLNGGALFTVRPASPRTLELVARSTSATGMKALEVALAAGGTITLSDVGQSDLVAEVILTGRVTRELDPKTARQWIVRAEVTENPT